MDIDFIAWFDLSRRSKFHFVNLFTGLDFPFPSRRVTNRENITIQSIFHCLDMFFILPSGKYSGILETGEIEEDHCSSYLVPGPDFIKQTFRK